MKLNLDFSLYKGTTRLKQWWKEVLAHFMQVQEAHNALDTALSDEVTARTNSDSNLKTQLNTHTASRGSSTVYGHVKLSDSVATSSSTATAATPAAVKTAYDKAVQGVNDAATVQTNLDTEVSNRQSADGTLQNNINTEAESRQSADTVINQRIDNLALNGNRNRLKDLSDLNLNNSCYLLSKTADEKQCLYLNEITVGNSNNNKYELIISDFDRTPEHPSNMIFEMGLAYRHEKYLSSGCTKGYFDYENSYIQITYADNTTADIYFKNSELAQCIVTESTKNISHASGNSYTYNYYLVRLYFRAEQEIKSIKLENCFSHNASSILSECEDYALIDKLGLYDNNSFATIREISELIRAISETEEYITFSDKITTAASIADDWNGLDVNVRVPDFVVHIDGRTFSMTGYSAEAVFTTYKTQYLYMRVDITADGELDVGDISMYDSADKSCITRLETGGYRVELLVGSGYYNYEPAPDGTPSASYDFEELFDDMTVEFNGTNEDNPFCLKLDTQSKISLVSAINEVNGNLNDLLSDVSSFETKLSSMNDSISTLSNELDEINNTPELMSTLDAHEQTTSASENGIHGMRYYNNKFEVFDGKNWVEVQKVYKTYGVSIDLANSDPEMAVTYTDDAVGMTAGSADWWSTNIFRGIKPCLFKNGEVAGYLNPDDFSKFEDGTEADITSGDTGDVMIEIPKLGYRIVTSGDILTVQVTDDPNAEGFSYLAHTRENEGDRDKLYIGAFLGYNLSSALRSLSEKTPTAEITIGQARTLAQANGEGYDQLAFYQITLLQCLFLIMYKNRNSQTALGMGYITGNTSATQTGGTVAKGMNYGETTGKEQMKFLGIEDLWGNLYQWVDGLVSTSDCHALTATDNFNDDGMGYTDRGQLASAYGYMETPQGTNETGFIIKSAGGSTTTYFADYACFRLSSLPCIGGCWDDTLDVGMFDLYVNSKSTSSDEYGGARLMYL